MLSWELIFFGLWELICFGAWELIFCGLWELICFWVLGTHFPFGLWAGGGPWGPKGTFNTLSLVGRKLLSNIIAAVIAFLAAVIGFLAAVIGFSAAVIGFLAAVI